MKNFIIKTRIVSIRQSIKRTISFMMIFWVKNYAWTPIFLERIPYHYTGNSSHSPTPYWYVLGKEQMWQRKCLLMFTLFLTLVLTLFWTKTQFKIYLLIFKHCLNYCFTIWITIRNFLEFSILKAMLDLIKICICSLQDQSQLFWIVELKILTKEWSSSTLYCILFLKKMCLNNMSIKIEFIKMFSSKTLY